MTLSAHHLRVRRALTDAELSTLSDHIAAATNSADLLAGVLALLFDALLADVGESRADYDYEQRLNPSTLAIPETQWSAIADAVTGRAHAWGTGVQLALELVNLMPASYADPAVPAPAFPRCEYRPDVVELHVSRRAADTIAACEAHLNALAGYFGADSREHREALNSWHRQLAALFSTAHGERVDISRDGALSLIVTTSGGLTFGIIFHGRRRACTTTGCHALTADGGPAGGPTSGEDGAPRWWPAYRDAPVLDHEHLPAYPLDAPQPGTWSFHS